jgi:predicted DNA-binding transcriptional regulator AlpA
MSETPTLVSVRQICELTSLSRTAISQRRKLDPTFPKPVTLGDKRIAFIRAEVVGWINERIRSREVA